uniref:Myotubularin phosphatase domain-containing protein n=3 Tax=Mesocestoides corti TaxID=53468 RepID=A0A5K3EMM1_MESCO
MDHIKLPKVDNVTFIDRFNGYAWIQGVLRITVTHTFFIDDSKRHEIWIQTCLIDRVERLPLTAYGAPLIIRGKDFRVACFLIRHDRDCQKVYDTLTRLAQVPSIQYLPCFRDRPLGLLAERCQGWDFFDLRSDFERMGLPNNSWVALDNSSYQICDTYPGLLFVPEIADRTTLLGSANFRSRRRLPVLTWIHPNGKAVLCRSSQPLSGLTSKSVDDQLMLRCIRCASGDGPLLYVVDTRPPLNALTNRAQGKGYEDVNVYKDIILRFLQIPNIHAVRGSLEKLLKVYQDPKVSLKDLNSAVDKSSWLRYLRLIVEAAYFIASRMEPEAGGYSFLVHCSDGWDRTAQVCSLAQLMIDPYYRTFNGFQALIEKDWLYFGHKFTDRCGLVDSVDPREVSPIFVQFLDCTHHLLELLPEAFEFNSRMLLELHDHSRSGLYGTFIGCSERERMQLGLSQKTYSSWAYFAENRHLFINPLYKPPVAFAQARKTTNRPHVTALLPAFVTSPHLFGPWADLFLRREWRIPSVSQRTVEVVDDLKTQTKALSAYSCLLRKRVLELSKLLGKSQAEIRDLLSLNGNREEAPYMDDDDDYAVVNDSDSSQSTFKTPVSDSLTMEGISKDLSVVNTRDVNLVAGAMSTCPGCSVLLASQTPYVRAMAFSIQITALKSLVINLFRFFLQSRCW